MVHVRLILPLHVILLYQFLNVLLDIGRIQNPATLGCNNDLADQLWMRDPPSTFHNTHDRGLRLVLPVRSDSLMRGLVLSFGLFRLDLIDLDPVFRMSEGGVDGEGISRVNIFALRRLAQRSISGTGKRLERTFEFYVICYMEQLG